MFLLVMSFKKNYLLKSKYSQINVLYNPYSFFLYFMFLVVSKDIKKIVNIIKVKDTTTPTNAVFFIKSLLRGSKQNNCIFPSFFLFYQNLFLQQLLVLPSQTKNINIITVLPQEILCVIMFNLKHIRW